MEKEVSITIAEGDGIGPEIMGATLEILKAASAPLKITKVEIGEKVYLKGHPTGIETSTWEAIRSSKAFLKAPITTPQGGGFKSLNVTIRTALGLYANVRPCVAYAPFVETKHPEMNVVIIRENEEDLYTGIEYRQTAQVYQATKLISRPGSEKIIRYAFEYARAHKRKKVTCFTKDNILKLSDGIFHHLFDEIAKEYSDIANEHWIVDIGAAKLADTPKAFDVVVLPNLYGDILSDVAAQIAGSVGLAGSANIGVHGAMFEAIHGSAPRRAGQNLANPSGLILAAVMMLDHVRLKEPAELIHNAWLKTIEDGVHTYDIFREKTSTQKVGTKEFAQAVIQRLGQKPQKLAPVQYGDYISTKLATQGSSLSFPQVKKNLVGIDVYIDHQGTLQQLYQHLDVLTPSALKLSAIYNRGVKVWPTMMKETFCVDQWRCRFEPHTTDATATHHQVISLLQQLVGANIDFTQTELLYTFDGIPGFF